MARLLLHPGASLRCSNLKANIYTTLVMTDGHSDLLVRVRISGDVC